VCRECGEHVPDAALNRLWTRRKILIMGAFGRARLQDKVTLRVNFYVALLVCAYVAVFVWNVIAK
jgi:hypothetical protein